MFQYDTVSEALTDLKKERISLHGTFVNGYGTYADTDSKAVLQVLKK